MAKRFINTAASVVPDLMQGLSLDSSRVALLDPSSRHHVLLRAGIAANAQTPRVSVVSGGGSGHEPMAGGFVADGMLAASVAGDVFASPSVPAICAMLRAVAPRSTGILVVVMNYQGDRLNFGQAVEQFRATDPAKPVDMLIVGDDVALPNTPEKRGIAGSVFVLKVAGAAADQGRPLPEVKNIAAAAARAIASFGVALEPCTIPGHAVDTARLSPKEIELGMGIHGEPGAETLALVELDTHNMTRELMATVCRRLDLALQTVAELPAQATGLAVLVNNLGAVSQAEMQVVADAVAHYLFGGSGTVLSAKRHAVHLFVGTFMTSLQMNGVSVSVFMLPNDHGIMRQLLLAPTSASAWTPGFPLVPPDQRVVVPMPGADARAANYAHITPARNDYYKATAAAAVAAGAATAGAAGATVPPTPILRVSPDSTSAGTPDGARPATRSGLHKTTELFVLSVTSALQSHREELTALDQKTGDGDFGDTVKAGCDAVRSALQDGRFAETAGRPGALFRSIAECLGVMGGTSGVLTRIFLLAAARSFDAARANDPERAWRDAFVAGTHAVMAEGGAQEGDRTAVDALKPAADVLAGPGSVSEAARAARVGCESTKSMTEARRGRSAHVRAEMLLNQADPGAVAVCIILDALVSAAS